MNLEVIEIVHPTPDSVSIRFKKPGHDFDYQPGQHGIFRINIDGQEFIRTYSFSSSPGLDQDPEITVRVVKEGVVSEHLKNSTTLNLTLQSVSGRFVLGPGQTLKRHAIMFAGGSGITPIISMIRALLLNEPLSSVTLIYSNRKFETIIFRKELDDLVAMFPSRFNIYHILSRDPAAPHDYPVFFRERLSKLIVKKLIRQIYPSHSSGVEFYLCGPFEFMKLIHEALNALGINPGSIHQEHFFIPPAVDESAFNNLQQREVLIQLPDEERLINVDAGKSILQAALSENVKLAYSCTEGQCGVCRAFLISGDVRMKQNHILTDTEIEKGEILLCQAFPNSNDVVIKSDGVRK
jgi:ring-1,2-phenylacetyl-CoA epoxidase subunit PaaE